VSYKSEIIDIKVSRRILWIGAEAYPLHNIARAQTITLVPRHGPAVWGYVKAIMFWLILGIAATFAGSAGLVPPDLAEIARIAALVLMVLSTIKLIRDLSRRKLYALIIETAGSPHTAVISRDKNIVTKLVSWIMDAINNPQAEFEFRVENLQVGDTVQQFGNQNVGKVTR
jgi:Family of unknown function (DUF6232)